MIDEGYMPKPGPNLHEGIDHMLWTLRNSPTTYAMFRERLIELQAALVNFELRHQELERQQSSAIK